MNNVEIAWMMIIEDNLAEIAAWANKQGSYVVVYCDDHRVWDETIYTVSSTALISDFDDD